MVSTKTTTAKCANCDKEFERPTSRFNEAVKNGWKQFCSDDCKHGNRRTSIKLKCTNCNKEILRKQSEIIKSKTMNFFCCKNCAATYNNKKYIKRKIKKIKLRFCLYCQKELKKQYKYCNNSCRMNYEKLIYLLKWFNKEITGSRGKDYEHISHYVKNFLFELYGNQCQECGWDKINLHTKKVPLEIHHNDGNWKNNKFENLSLLCPNCHSLTQNYRNGGNKETEGRPGKREFYKKYKSTRWDKSKEE